MTSELSNSSNNNNNIYSLPVNNTQKKMIKNITDILKPFYITGGDNNIKPSNTRIGDKKGIAGGSYFIPNEKYNEFLDKYYECVVSKKTPDYITEIQLENDGPILIDIDLRFQMNVESRIYTDAHIEDLLDSYLEELKKIYQFDNNSQFYIFVFEKTAIKKIPEKELVKDGIHILIGIKTERATQQILRKKMLQNISELWSDFQITCSWEDVLDSGITTGKVPWQLYGSTKPGFEPYAITKIFHVSYDPEDEEFMRKKIQLDKFDLKKNFPKISARNIDNPSFFFKTQFMNERQELLSNGEITCGSNKPPRKKNTSSSSDNTNILDIKNHDELSSVLDEFLDKIGSPQDYKLKEAYYYTMTLPESYYGDGSYTKWISVGWALRNTSDCLFIVWIAFSSQYKKFDFRDIPDLYEKWRKFDLKNPSGLTERSIMHWSKKDARDKYNKVRENSIDFYMDKTVDASPIELSSKKNTKACGDFEIAFVLYQLFKDEFVCVSVKANIWYTYKKHRWEEIDSGTTLRKLISLELHALYKEKMEKIMAVMIKETDEDKKNILRIKTEKIFDICQRLVNTNGKQNIMTESKELFYDGTFLQKMDTNTYLICFNNGVFDFKNKVFRKGYPEDYISKSTNIDYIPIDRKRDHHVISQITDFMDKLFPIKELNQYMWEHLASTLVGTSSNQTFNMYIGGGSNGKSVLISLMELVLGEYKGDVPLSLVTDKRTRIGGLAPEMVALKGIRLAVMQEPQKGDKINEGVMKQITSGIDPIQARAPYMPQAITFIPQFKLVVCANIFMEIKSQDHGTWRRIRVVDFMSLFTDNPVSGDSEKPYQFKKEDDIIEKFNDWKEVFASLLVEKVLETNGVVKDCPIVMKSSNSYRESQDYIAEFIADRIVIDPNGQMTKSELKAEFEIWYQGTYGKGGPSMKDVHADMDKRFGKFDKFKCWKGGRINYDREVFIENEDNEEIEESELVEEDHIDIDNL